MEWKGKEKKEEERKGRQGEEKKEEDLNGKKRKFNWISTTRDLIKMEFDLIYKSKEEQLNARHCNSYTMSQSFSISLSF